MEINISGKTKLAGLFAQPAGHSISPAIHTAAFAAMGIDAVYLSFDISPEKLAEAVETIRIFQMLGVNLSYPHKKAVMPYLDELSPAAELIGAVNTIVNQAGHLVGYNTDGLGFMKSLYEKGFKKNQRLTIIGTGGAANAIIAQAALDGVAEIAVFNRKGTDFQQKTERLREIQQRTDGKIALYDLADIKKLNEKISESAALINATTLGMTPEINRSPLNDYSSITSELIVCDLIYQPRETLFLKEARQNGATTMNGLNMLLYQAAFAFELWTGQEMPVEVIRPIIEK